MLEYLKISSFIIMFAMVYAFVNNDDYHKKFDKQIEIRYNCDMLVGGWNPDVPPEVIRECRETHRREVIVKTYQE